jgi:RNA polymerase sigma factor (sigma-70 family)
MSINDEKELLVKYHPWVCKTAHGMCVSRPDRYEDLAQEGWIALWQATKTWDGQAPFDWWLKYRAHGAMLVLIKRWSRYDRNAYRRGVGSRNIVLTSESIDMAYHYREIRTALLYLTPRQREYVVLRFWGGYRKTELIAYFGYDPQGIWTQGKKKLSRMLEHLRS